jgi:hypothetical protein
MPSLIKIPYSTVEYQARFLRPVIQLIAGEAAPIQAVVDALLPFGFQFAETGGTCSPQDDFSPSRTQYHC